MGVAGFGGVMRFMAGNLSNGLVDGLDHSCWIDLAGQIPAASGREFKDAAINRQPLQLMRSLLRLPGRRLDADTTSNAFALERFHWLLCLRAVATVQD
jgi:hypothetical protein